MKRPLKIKKQISDTLTKTCKESDILLIGLTGGIATGKSTVASRLEDLGAVIIDFDILARNVVEPGKTSWKLIVDFFGESILNPDLKINRKKLSAIVFGSKSKREKLESFTHPFIWDEFICHVKDAGKKAIIFAVIPLLIEGDMHDLFSKIVIIYSSPEIQIKRLMKRDGISREMAERILGAQMPIDDKVPFGDFIIKNEGTVEDTEKQVNTLWEELITASGA